MKATGFILLFILSSCSSDKITDLKGKKFVLVESDTMYMFDHTAYLYHIANLSNILAPYENIMRSYYRKHGKYELNQKVSKCNNEFINISKCKNYLGITG